MPGIVALVALLALAGCGSPSDDSEAEGGNLDDGATSDRPLGGGPVAPLCQQFEPCGGNLIGSWEVVEGCVQSWDTIWWGEPPECEGQITELGYAATGTVEFRDGGNRDDTVDAVFEKQAAFTLVVTDTCAQQLSGEPISASFCDETRQRLEQEMDTAACEFSRETCRCEFAVGGREHIFEKYRVWGDVNFTVIDSATEETSNFDFCVQGDELELRDTSEDHSRAVVYRLRRTVP